jgi:hypothetical protein
MDDGRLTPSRNVLTVCFFDSCMSTKAKFVLVVALVAVVYVFSSAGAEPVEVEVEA